MKNIPPKDLVEKDFGSVYTTTGSSILYISFYYFGNRLRFPMGRKDTPKNREELRKFLNDIGKKIDRGTFQFAKTFYWLNEETKKFYSQLEGTEMAPEPEHVFFGDYAKEWMEKTIPAFSSPTKQRDYLQVLNSRLLPHFRTMTFAQITATAVNAFIDTLARCDRTKGRAKTEAKDLSVKRIKNIIGPLKKIWQAASDEYNWDLRNPFSGCAVKYAEINDVAVQTREQEELERFLQGLDEEDIDTREVFLLSEWKQVMQHVDPHYHLAMQLLMSGMIGSELEGLMKRYIDSDRIKIRAVVKHGPKGTRYLKFKPKNWFRKRDIPITIRLRKLLEAATQRPTSTEVVTFSDGMSIPANAFVLTMADGSPFNYARFRKTVWNPALKKAGLPPKVPYASRHTFVQWALILGVTKTRLVDLMGHCNKNMIDQVYGNYRHGLVEEREQILDYLGEDFLALEELKVAFPERYRARMAA